MDCNKVKSRNALEHIDFHECVINKTEWDNNNLLLYFSSVNVLKTHPDNYTGKAKETDNAIVHFENMKVIKSQCYTDEVEIKDIDFLDALNNLHIYCLAAEKNGDKSICKVEGATVYEDFQDFRDIYKTIHVKIEFEYSNADVYYNNFTGNAWFDNGVVWNGISWVTEKALST